MNAETNSSRTSVLLVRFGIIIATLLLVVGLISPMLTMSQFYFFESSFSVIGGVWSLLLDGQVILAVIIALFSIVLPFLKLGLLYSATLGKDSEQQKKMLTLMHDYGRWAMLDVMVVAILIVTVKLGAVASIETHWGLYVFALAVLLIMVLTHIITKAKHG